MDGMPTRSLSATGTADEDFAKRLKFKINFSLNIKGKMKKQMPEEVSLQDMMTNEAYAPTQHDRDVFTHCVGDFREDSEQAPFL